MKVSPAAPHPKKNNTKECDCCPGRKDICLHCPKHNPKKEERCTCASPKAAEEWEKKKTALKYDLDYVDPDCPLHGIGSGEWIYDTATDGEPKLPSERIREIAVKRLGYEHSPASIENSDTLSCDILDYLDTKPWEK